MLANYKLSSNEIRPQSVKRIPKVTVAAIVFCFAILIYFSVPEGNPFRYLIYFVPAVTIIEASSQRLIIIRLPLFLLAAHIVFSISTLIVHGATWYFYRDFLITILIMIPFSVQFKLPHYFSYLLMTSIVTYLIAIFVSSGGKIGGFGISLGQSQSVFEGTLGLISPLLVFYYFQKKKYGYAVICALISVLMFKRIAIAAMIISVLYGIILSKLKNKRLAQTISMILILLIWFLSININQVFEIVSNIYLEYFGTSVGPDSFSSGRYSIFAYIWNAYLSNQSILQWIFGRGVGRSAEIMGSGEMLSFTNLPLLHNDWMKILIDYGISGSAIIIFTLSVMSSKNLMYSMVSIYTAILFSTDNVVVYASYWLVALFLLRLSYEDVKN